MIFQKKVNRLGWREWCYKVKRRRWFPSWIYLLIARIRTTLFFQSKLAKPLMLLLQWLLPWAGYGFAYNEFRWLLWDRLLLWTREVFAISEVGWISKMSLYLLKIVRRQRWWEQWVIWLTLGCYQRFQELADKQPVLPFFQNNDIFKK